MRRNKNQIKNDIKNTNIEKNIREIKEYCLTLDGQKDKILVLGSTNPLFFGIYEILRQNKRFEFVWMRYKKNYSETFTHGMVIKIPKEINRSFYHELVEKVEISPSQIDCIDNNEYYTWAYKNIIETFPYDNHNNVRKVILQSEYYFKSVFDVLKPKALILWNPYVSFNKVAESVAKEMGITVIYAESGVIPQTIALSTWGDLGESRPAREPKFFKNLPINETDISNTRKLLIYLRETGINRNIQPVRTEIPFYDKRKPLILLAGQNDSECGLQPYDAKAHNYSPCFSSSHESLEFIAKLAEKYDWNLIYKPHPIVERRRLEMGNIIPSNVILVGAGDINQYIDICDVCVTILSTTAYISLIRNKPVVMLGKITLFNQGCTYQALDKESVETVLVEAVKMGYTNEQKDAFESHMARMSKYYLYSKEESWGCPIGDMISFIESALNGEALF